MFEYLFFVLKLMLLNLFVIISHSLTINIRDNAQVPPQPMPEIPETHLYYTKVLLPPELILLIIFNTFSAYVALPCGPNDG